MKVIPIVLIVAILGVMAWYFISGYSSSTTKTEPEKIHVTDTMLIVKDSIINAGHYDSIPSGFYQGMLPCKTCEGVQRTLLFGNDGHFKMEELNWGKGTPARRVEGTWEKENGRFILYQADKAIAKYRISKDSLINTDNYGSSIPDSLSKQYVLFKKNTAPESAAWRKRKSEGIDIIGTGSDPFWSVEIDNEKFILFKLTGAPRPVIVPIEKPVINKDSSVWAIMTDGGALLKVSVSSRFCGDGVSDHVYEYKMNVWYKGQMYKGCAVVLGGEE
jgi:uncharacterized membrane protein